MGNFLATQTESVWIAVRAVDRVTVYRIFRGRGLSFLDVEEMMRSLFPRPENNIYMFPWSPPMGAFGERTDDMFPLIYMLAGGVIGGFVGRSLPESAGVGLGIFSVTTTLRHGRVLSITEDYDSRGPYPHDEMTRGDIVEMSVPRDAIFSVASYLMSLQDELRGVVAAMAYTLTRGANQRNDRTPLLIAGDAAGRPMDLVLASWAYDLWMRVFRNHGRFQFPFCNVCKSWRCCHAKLAARKQSSKKLGPSLLTGPGPSITSWRFNLAMAIAAEITYAWWHREAMVRRWVLMTGAIRVRHIPGARLPPGTQLPYDRYQFGEVDMDDSVPGTNTPAGEWFTPALARPVMAPYRGSSFST